MDRRSVNRPWFGRRGVRTGVRSLLARSGDGLPSSVHRKLAEGLEQRLMLAGFDPLDTGVDQVVNSDPMMMRTDVSIFDINGTAEANYDQVTIGTNVRLDGVMRLRFGGGLNLTGGNQFELIRRTGGATLSNSFLAIEGLESPTDGIDLVLIQSPERLVLVATTLPSADVSIVAATDAEAGQLISFFAAGSAATPVSIDGEIRAIGQSVWGRFDISQTMDGGGVVVGIGLGPRGATEAQLGRVTAVVSGFSAAAVYGSGTLELRARDAADVSGLRLTGFAPVGFTLAPGYGGVNTPSTNLIMNGVIGPLKFTRLESIAPTFVADRTPGGEQRADVSIGFSVQKIDLAFTAGGGENPGQVRAEITLIDELSLDIGSSYDGMAVNDGGLTGGFGIQARRLEVEVPNVIKVVGTAGLIINYNPQDTDPEQMILQTWSLSVEIPKLKLKGAIDSPVGAGSEALIIYKNGFQFGLFTIALDTSTFGGGEAGADPDGYLRIGSAIKIKNPSLRMNRFGLRFADDGSVATSSLESVGFGLEEIRIGPDNSTFFVTGSNIQADILVPDNNGNMMVDEAPNGLRLRAASLSFGLGRFITASATNIEINTAATGSERALIVSGNLSATLSLGSLFGAQAGSPDANLTLTGSAGGFAIKGDGSFEPFTNMTLPVEYRDNTFHVDFAVSTENLGRLLSGVQFPAFLSSLTNASLSVGITWPNFDSDPSRFLLRLGGRLAGDFRTVSFDFSITDLAVDTAKLLADPPRFPIISLGSVTGEITANMMGATLTGNFILGVAKFNDQGEALDDVTAFNNPDLVADSVVYAGGRVDFMLANRYGVDLRFGFSELGFLQAYISVNAPILIDPVSGLTLDGLRGGVTFNASPFPNITDPVDLRGPLFKPTRTLTPQQWESQLGLLVANQKGGNPGFLFRITDQQIRERYPADAENMEPDSLQNWIDQLDTTDDLGLFLPRGLRAELLAQGFAFTKKAGYSTTIQLDANDLWLVIDRGQQYMLQRNLSDNSMSVYSIGFSIVDDAMTPGEAFDSVEAVTNTDAMNPTPVGDVAGLAEAFEGAGIILQPGATIYAKEAGVKWEVNNNGSMFLLTLRGRTGSSGDMGTRALIVTGGNGAFGVESVTKIEAGFTLYSQYASSSSFNIKADAIVTTDGKIVLFGDMVFGENNAAGGTSEPVSIEASVFIDLTQLAAGTGNILFLGDVKIADSTIPIVSIFGRLTFGFYLRGTGGSPDVLIDLDYLMGNATDRDGDGRLTLNDLFLAGTRPDYFKIELAGSETQGIAVFDTAGIPGNTFAVQRVRLGGKAITPTVAGRESYGFVALSFDFDELRFNLEFDANISFEGLISADSVVAAAGNFELDFRPGSNALGIPEFEAFYGAMKLTASTESIEPLRLAGIAGAFNATLKINTSAQQRSVVLQLPGQNPETIILQRQSFGLFADTQLTFTPPVVGALFHPKIIGAFGLEISRDSGFSLFIIGTMPVPIPAAAAAGITADVLGLLRIMPNGNIAARLELGMQNDPSQVEYFSIGAALQFYMNSSGQEITYTMPRDIATRLGATLPATLAGRLVFSGDGDASIVVPARAPLINYSTTGETDPMEGGYLVIQGFGHIFVTTPGSSTPFLDINGSARLALQVAEPMPGQAATQFRFDLEGSVAIGPLVGISINAGAVIAMTFSIPPVTVPPSAPTITSINFAALLEIRGVLALPGGILTLDAEGSVRINTFGTAQRVAGIDLDPRSVSVHLAGDLRIGPVFRLSGSFTFLNNSEKLSVSGSAELDLIVAQVGVSIAAEVYKGADPGFVLDVAIGVNVGFYNVFTLQGNGRLQVNTRSVATTLPTGNTVPARIDASTPYINIHLAAAINIFSIVTIRGFVDITTINDTAWQEGWSSPKRNWRIQGALRADAFFGIASVQFGNVTDPYAPQYPPVPVTFYDSGEFAFDAALRVQLGPDEFNVGGQIYVHARRLRENDGDPAVLDRRDLMLEGSGRLNVNVDVDLGEIDLGLLGTIDLGSIRFSFDLVAVTFAYNGNTGELSLTACVIGICKTFTVGFFGETPAPPINLAGPAVSAYAQNEYGYWVGPWTGGTLFLNTGDVTDNNRARLRNLSEGVIDEDYIIEPVGGLVNGRQTLKIKAFGQEQTLENVTDVVANLGNGNDNITIRPGVLVPVYINGGAGGDKITYQSTGLVTILGGAGNDRIAVAGAPGSSIDAGLGSDVVTWLAGTNITGVSISAGEDPDELDFDQFVATFTAGDDRIRFWRAGSEQFRLSRLNGSGGEVEHITAQGGFESVRINAGDGRDEVRIADFNGGLNLYVDASRYQSGTRSTPIEGGTRQDPVFTNDAAQDLVIVEGSQGADRFTITTPSDTLDLDADTDTTERHISVTRAGAYTLWVLNATSGAVESLRIETLGGDDEIDASGAAGFLATLTLVGGGGNDTITGSPFADFIYGDQADGTGTGNDTLRGGAGDDYLHGAGGNNFLYGDGGHDILVALGGDDHLDGGDGNDSMNAGNGRNTLFGRAGHDVMIAGGGNDFFDGGEGNDTIYSGLGDDTVTGGAGTDVYHDEGGRDTFIETRNTDVTITDNTFIVGTVRASSRDGFADDYLAAEEYETLHRIFETAFITGGAGNNLIVVGDVDGFAMINGVRRRIGRQWRGTLHLDGLAGADRYVVTVFGDAGALVNINDTGGAGDPGDTLVVYGSDDDAVQDQFLVRANFIAALAGQNAQGVFSTADRINFTTAVDAGATVNGLRGDDRFVVDDTSIPTTLNGGLGRDFFQFGQLFGADRQSPWVAVGDEIETTAVNLTPADAPAGSSTTGYLTNGVSVPATANGGDGEDRFVVFRNLAELDLNGDGGNDTFSVRAFVLDDGTSASRGAANIVGGDGADFIEYATNADVNIDGGEGVDAIRILGTQFGDTFVVTDAGIAGAGLRVNYERIEALELHTGDGNDTVYILSTLPTLRTAVFGGAGSDHVFVGFDVPAFPPSFNIPEYPPQPGNLQSIRGPVLFDGGPGDPGVFGLSTSVMLPTEGDKRLPPGTGAMSDHEGPDDVDILDINDTGATTDDHGLHSARVWPNGSSSVGVHTLSGLGMGGDRLIGDETVPGGISYARLEVFELALGSGGETIEITSVSDGTTTVFRGNGGGDAFNVSAPAAQDALLVIYGDTSADRSHTGSAGADTIDASASAVRGVYSGGPGSDTILGGSADDRIAGGSGGDVLGGGGGDDLLLGDSGFSTDRLTRVTAVLTAGLPSGGMDNLDQVGDDTINPGDGRDVVFGDHGEVTLVGGAANVLAEFGEVSAARTINAALGGNDTISARAATHAAFVAAGWPEFAGGGDFIFGGAGEDGIFGGSGDDVILGDVGVVSFNLDGDSSTTDLVEIDQPNIGAADLIHAGAGNDAVLAGAGADTVYGEEGNDLVFGDFGRLAGSIDLSMLPLTSPNFAFTSASTTAAFAGAADTLSGDSGDDILVGGQGADSISGGADNDDIIGGHNVAGGHDGSDRIDAGSGHDAVAGDNAVVVRQPGSVSPRFRTLTGQTIYGADLAPQVSGFGVADPAGSPARSISLLDHAPMTFSVMFGHDVIAGGAGNDVIFGQLGDDRIRGDGALNIFDGSADLSASSSPSADGDDYIEGNGGNDRIWGDLGQDDLIGGSSNLFGLSSAALRPDGADVIFGGVGSAITRNHAGDTSEFGHARDADVILGDNGRIFRLIGPGGAFLTFNYDNYSTGLRIIPRAVELLDYLPSGEGAGNVGGDDTIRGEAGDDIIYGATGHDTLYGDGQDDDLYGGAGNDWLFGGTGDDGIVADDGLLTTARNGVAEPLYGLNAVQPESLNSGSSIIVTTIFAAGELTKYARLSTFDLGGDDVAYGGLGNDFIHGGAGLDALSGAEALPAFYDVGQLAVRPSLTYSPSLRRFLQFDPGTGMRRLNSFFLNFEAYTGSGADTVRIDDGRDSIFGDHGHDWLVGGTNQDRLFGGMGDDVLNADDNLDTNNGLNSSSDSAPFNEADIAFGGGGLDRLIGNTINDRLIDWVDQFNQYLTPFSGNPPVVVRQPTANLITALLALGRGSGADQLLAEPYGELGLVRITDPEWVDQLGRPNVGVGAPSGPRFGDQQLTGNVPTTFIHPDDGRLGFDAVKTEDGPG